MALGAGTTTPEKVRAALDDLTLMVAAHLVPGANPNRAPLLAALRRANEVLRADLVAVLSVEDIADAEDLVRRWINAGGDWHALVAAVNRNALWANAPCRREREQETRP